MPITSMDEAKMLDQLGKTKIASRKILHLEDDQIVDILNRLAAITLQKADFILAENKKDLDRMDSQNPKYDRLLLNRERLEGIASDLRNVAALPSPLYQEIENRTVDSGLRLKKVTVPLGMVGIVYESRPNVTFDVFALCLKSGNASVLKGSRDAHFSNLAIVQLIREVLSKDQLEEIVYLAPSEREALPVILAADEYINTIIPRGGQGLIKFVRENSRVPVIETGAGIVHTYYDKGADLAKGKRIVENAKSRRVSVCNALDTLIIHQDRLNDLPELMHALGNQHHCELYADEAAYETLEDTYPKSLLHRADATSFGTEFLSMKLSIRTVPDLTAALEHIARYSSQHSEAIITEDQSVIEQFQRHVDAAVVYANTSTAFTDGAQFGLGAEIGISTQKLHARGPMALRELTSYKWIVSSDGRTRP